MATHVFHWQRRHLPVSILIGIIFLNSLVLWIMGIGATVLGVKRDAPDSTAVLYFYFCGIAMVSTLVSTAELILHWRGALNQIASLSWALISLLGWSVVLGLWGGCETGGDVGSTCVGPFYENPNFPNVMSYPPRTPGTAGFWKARVAFGVVALILSALYVGLASAAIHKTRSAGAQKSARVELHPRKRLQDDEDSC